MAEQGRNYGGLIAHDVAAGAAPDEHFEHDAPPNRGIMGAVIVLGIVLVASFLGVAAMVRVHAQEQRMSGDAFQAQLEQVRADARAKIEGYVQRDAAAGAYQIPVSVAMERVVQQPELLGKTPLRLAPPTP